MTITKRVPSGVTASNSKRVVTSGTVPTIYGDTWGGTFKGWGNTWSNITDAVTAVPFLNVSKRVAGAITENTTKRVTGI